MTAARAETHERTEAALLYVGEVMHARLKPMSHRFRYRVMSLLIDLDLLDAANRQSPLFGVNRAALYSFHECDHGLRDGSSLRDYAQRCAAQHGVDLTGGRVRLLCCPRLLGYTFNPLSVYFCHSADGALALIIYEVRNTFGEIHPYVLPVRPGELTEAGLRQSQDKTFYVSPFVGMAMRYQIRLSPPADHGKLGILETDRNRPVRPQRFAADEDCKALSSCFPRFYPRRLLSLSRSAGPSIGRRFRFGSRGRAWCRASTPRSDITIATWRAAKGALILVPAPTATGGAAPVR